MLFKPDRNCLKYVFYVSLTAVIIFISYNIIFSFGSIAGGISDLLGYAAAVLSPLITGIVIAYLLFPLTDFINKFLAKTFKMKRKPYLLSVILTYVLMLLFITLLIYSVYAIINGKIADRDTLQNTPISMMLATIGRYIARYNELFEYINGKILQSGLSIDLKGYINQVIEQISKFIAVSFSGLFRFSRGFGISVINSLLGLIISFYLLKDYEFFEKT
jgi:predicted PurR-regulated permease PerM